MLRLTPALLVLALALSACGSSDKQKTTAAGTPPPSTVAGQDPATTAPPEQQGGCKQVDQPAATSRKGKKPSGSLTAGKAYSVVLQTSCGTIDIALDTKQDPKTAASFAGLVRSKFFDGLGFHRVVPGFVIQGGDPKGDGTGDAGYDVVEKPPADQQYTKGVVAMAKGGADPAGSSSSQFFIVTGDDAGLPAEYAVAGKVTKGQDVADAIASLGAQGADGPPSQPVVIEKATLTTK